MTIKTILIDAAHREETRIAVLENGILQDFDREAYSIKQIKGNIYLAKVTRVEASLQAAFVDYGEERHGFLPFGDIHPHYYQLSEEEKKKIFELSKENQTAASESENEENFSHNQQNHNEENSAITTGSYSVEEETEKAIGNIYNIHKRYNIQDVIKPGQLILIQVNKEERGNKGASMTTYISLAGKYCVLMANTPNKGGVSKKVDNFRDRKILRAILNDMNVPVDRSVIMRTAGVGKRPEDLKRDYEYLNRLWENIQEIVKSSNSPTFIHAEDDVIRRCIRDVYNEQTNEVVVEGKQAFETVVNFAKLTMPNAANNIRLHEERIPIFNKFKVEKQISSLYEKKISLPSGGSIVIDHTEALVAIDVNSGKSTRESGVEEMAYNTNLEAVKEVAKQVRLRDLAGLIVIDFIDMHDQKNRRAIERALRDEMQNDRARIQLGRISAFGLLELSRQRLGASFFETITKPCTHCNGTGYVRSIEILAVSILRAIRHACGDHQAGVIYVYTSPEVIAYMTNYKRAEINTTESNYNIHIFLHISEEVGHEGFTIKKRKGLSDEERREFEMEIATGKVNKSDLERSYFENHANYNSQLEDEIDGIRSGNKNHHKHHHNKKRNKFKKDFKRNNSFSYDKKPSVVKSVLSKFLGK